MSIVRTCLCAAALALAGGVACAEDLDVSALQAKIAELEARINDQQARMSYTSNSSVAETQAVTSMKKNSVVTIGGQVNTRYMYHEGSVMSSIDAAGTGYRADNDRVKLAETKTGDLAVTDAKLRIKADVTDYFDAYLQIDPQDSDGRRSDAAEKYWIRWKTVCNSGFGLLVGRDSLVFGDHDSAAIPAGWTGGSDYLGGAHEMLTHANVVGGSGVNIGADFGEGMFAGGNSLVPTHTGWDYGRTTQITPYWEGLGGKIKMELSLFQSLDRMDGGRFIAPPTALHGYYKSINYGVGTSSARITLRPIEGLMFSASAVNFRSNVNYDAVPGHAGNVGGVTLGHGRFSTNNSAVNVAAQYRPRFLPRVNLWSQWTHGWNEAWVKDMDSDSVNFGLSIDLTEQLTFYAQGDYLRVLNNYGVMWHEGSGWAANTGFKYVLPYGVDFEAGWRYERTRFRNSDGFLHTKAKMNTLYGHLGFQF